MKLGWVMGGLWSMATLAAEPSTLSIYSVEYPPLVLKGESGKLSGIAVEAVAQALQLAGLGVRMPEIPWKRAQMQVQQDADSCLMPFTRSPEREKMYRWVGLVMESNQSLFINSHHPVVLNSLDDAKGKRIVVLLGSSMADYLKKNNIAYSVRPTPEEAERELAAGVADVWAVHDVVANYTIKQVGTPADHIREALQVQPTSIYMACSLKMSDATALKLNRAFQQLRESGKLEKIVAKYMK
ncbi:amino acid ABC transporter substrate-binding protein [Chromobacterium haemolyticum]|uniref:Amino acid ABC transporter substrate-binding protein n=1 Tax=Chromobacterium fluminis TaxID=3044269 RepID=A0ABX0LK05_9NEIS|nr:transporter substrate-binding domain-containing protein [Chromobacterium haemolyticum]NHR08820.1 amino acid ABC transporter substrate-binding protein [Chromobacterium haemolyticum]